MPDRSTGPQVAFVTGASGAFGAAAARVLADRGYRVAVHSMTNNAAAEALADELDGSLAVRADVAIWDEVKAAVARVEAELGPIAVAVNAAGVRHDGLMAGQSPGEWQRTISVNLMGTFHVCRAVVPEMLRRRFGRIINVVSPAALVASPGQTAYAASKAGVVALTKTLAAECGRRNVTVNALSPGYMETPMTASLPNAVKEGIRGRTALRRVTDPDEVARAIPFILDTAYMTGQVVSVDGGIAL